MVHKDTFQDLSFIVHVCVSPEAKAHLFRHVEDDNEKQNFEGHAQYDEPETFLFADMDAHIDGSHKKIFIQNGWSRLSFWATSFYFWKKIKMVV